MSKFCTKKESLMNHNYEVFYLKLECFHEHNENLQNAHLSENIQAAQETKPPDLEFCSP